MSEGPHVAQLAQDNPDLHVVGLGAQDDLEAANNFIGSLGLDTNSLTMVWDPSFDSWRQFGIRAQPYWVLYNAAGEEVASRPGIVDLAVVQGALGA